jgi:radical SAM superfamily enzyme YgiQ (UPF0313 family)
MSGTAPAVINASQPAVDEIPVIAKPSINSLVEITRGCGRMCSFCSPTMRRKRDIPIERIKQEVKVNMKCGKKDAWLHSEDALLYGLDSKDFQPNRDSVLELFGEVSSLKGIAGIGMTHISLSAVAADPELIRGIAGLCRSGPGNWMGVQPGIETGSPEIIKKGMRNKAKPFQPEEWPRVVKDAIEILNENYLLPACTIMVGTPCETEDDVRATIDLVDSLEGKMCVLAPLMYTDIGSSDSRISKFDDLGKDQKELIYKCWRHSFLLFNRKCGFAFANYSPFMRIVTSSIVRLGSRAIVYGLDKMLRKQI